MHCCRHAGVLFGISNTIGTIPGFLAPTLAGLITPNVSSFSLFVRSLKCNVTGNPISNAESLQNWQDVYVSKTLDFGSPVLYPHEWPGDVMTRALDLPRVRLSEVVLSGNNVRQVVHTHTSSVTKQCTWYRSVQVRSNELI